MKSQTVVLCVVLPCFIFLSRCKSPEAPPSKALISEINLKRGALISCGPAKQTYGVVHFAITGSKKAREDFQLGLALLHSFEYEEAEKVFAKIIDEAPQTAMAYWGVAMSNYHPLWLPPTPDELQKGSKAIKIAQSIKNKSNKETDFINAIATYYTDWQKTDHMTRCKNYEAAMERNYNKYTGDIETAVFYALAIDAAADPTDKTFANQKKSGAILFDLYPTYPNHPGIAHYIIHTYDYPELARIALPAARKYASIAPSSSHALHMPSHIFTRLGLWDEAIKSNLAASASAKCYAETAGLKGHFDEELHSMDYLMYAYLQKGENNLAKQEWDYLQTIKQVYPVNFKVAYAFAAIPSRYLLENKMWAEAAALPVHNETVAFEKYPWQQAMIYFTRLLGSVHTNKLKEATAALQKLNALHDTLVAQKDAYKANQVAIQMKAGEGWINLLQRKNDQALALMSEAADMEDKTEKHPVTPCELIPAKELLADMLMQMEKPSEALAAYEADLFKHNNRFNGLSGAALAAERSGDTSKAKLYYSQLLRISNKSPAGRPEITKAIQVVRN